MLTLVAILSLVTYRVTRFILEDSLIAQPRIWLKAKLLGYPTRDAHELDLFYMQARLPDERSVNEARLKAYELLDCHHCSSIWVGAGAVALTDWQTSVPLPVWVWLCSSAGAVVIWRWVEG